ncbi:hypothetical protein HMPREF1977_2178 [Capnocytophaga ochracea F0287]|uniref:Uncharacterized protein n=1 Tax=Capnocytophaga ochracea F0287 TaxID=873517 RepID=E4MUW8_CAPOC|nr:hypothetical protein HMPREF1977_2178 [Capnocytophaga ochracea F0287]
MHTNHIPNTLSDRALGRLVKSNTERKKQRKMPIVKSVFIIIFVVIKGANIKIIQENANNFTT